MTDEVPFDLRTDRYLAYDAATPGDTLEQLYESPKATLASERQDSPVFRVLPELRAQERSKFLPVPREFRDEVEYAARSKLMGKLAVLGQEAKGSLWESEGLRVVGREQFHAKAFEAAAATLEDLRTVDPLDEEANLLLGTIYQRLGALRNMRSSVYSRIRSIACSKSWRRRRPHPRRRPGLARSCSRGTRSTPPAERSVVFRPARSRSRGPRFGRRSKARRRDTAARWESPAPRAAATSCFTKSARSLASRPRYLALPPEAYVTESVAPAGPDWVRRFHAIQARFPSAPILARTKELPGWLRHRSDYSIWQRNNLWMLNEALAAGAQNLTLIALWNGKKGDGPGGTADMIKIAQERGAETRVLDSNAIFGLTGPAAATDV